jgi:hypothetical protein
MRSLSATKRLLSIVAFSTAVVGVSPCARADTSEATAAYAAGYLIVGGLVLTSVPFAIHNIVVAAKDEIPTVGWSVAELCVTTPTTLIMNGAYGFWNATEETPLKWSEGLVIGFVSSLPFHGAIALARPDVNPKALIGLSLASGFDLFLSTAAISFTPRKRLMSRPFGILTLVTTAPQIAVFGYELYADSKNRDAWIGLTAWSSTLFLYGIASTVWGERPPSALRLAQQTPSRVVVQPHVSMLREKDRHGAMFTIAGSF